MASEAVVSGTGRGAGLSVTSAPAVRRSVIANIAAGALATGLLAVFKTPLATGFAVGYIIGVVNLLWLLRIARRAVAMAPHRAQRFVARHYFMRFAATALVLGVLISKRYIEPWPPVGGLTLCVLTTIGVMLYSAKEEVNP